MVGASEREARKAIWEQATQAREDAKELISQLVASNKESGFDQEIAACKCCREKRRGCDRGQPGCLRCEIENGDCEYDRAEGLRCPTCDKQYFYKSALARHQKNCGKAVEEREVYRCSTEGFKRQYLDGRNPGGAMESTGRLAEGKEG